MAKGSKKILKKMKTPTKKTESIPVNPLAEVKPAPPIDPGMVSVNFVETDLVALANLMTVVTKIFEQLALTAAEENEPTRFKILQARYQLSNAFATKFADCVRMPEPLSRDMH